MNYYFNFMAYLTLETGQLYPPNIFLDRSIDPRTTLEPKYGTLNHYQAVFNSVLHHGESIQSLIDEQAQQAVPVWALDYHGFGSIFRDLNHIAKAMAVPYKPRGDALADEVQKNRSTGFITAEIPSTLVWDSIAEWLKSQGGDKFHLEFWRPLNLFHDPDVDWEANPWYQLEKLYEFLAPQGVLLAQLPYSFHDGAYSHVIHKLRLWAIKAREHEIEARIERSHAKDSLYFDTVMFLRKAVTAPQGLPPVDF